MTIPANNPNNPNDPDKADKRTSPLRVTSSPPAVNPNNPDNSSTLNTSLSGAPIPPPNHVANESSSDNKQYLYNGGKHGIQIDINYLKNSCQNSPIKEGEGKGSENQPDLKQEVKDDSPNNAYSPNSPVSPESPDIVDLDSAGGGALNLHTNLDVLRSIPPVDNSRVSNPARVGPSVGRPASLAVLLASEDQGMTDRGQVTLITLITSIILSRIIAYVPTPLRTITTHLSPTILRLNWHLS